MVMDQLETHMQKNESRLRPYIFSQKVSPGGSDLHVKHKTMKLLEKNIEEM